MPTTTSSGKSRRSRKIVHKGKKKAPTNKQLAIKIKKLEHTDELKYEDFQYSASVYNNNSTMFYLSGMAQGDNFNQRVGEVITAKYLSLKLRLGNLAGASNVMYRAVLWWDKNVAGVGPNLLSSTSSNVTSLLDDTTITSLLFAPRNQRTKERYQILMDKVWAINPNSTSMEERKFVKKNFQLGGAKVKFNGSGSAVSSTTERGLFLWVYATGPGTDLTSTLTATRMFYTDD